LQQGEDVLAGQFRAAVEEGQLDHEPQSDDLACHILHQFHGSGRGAAGGQQIVDDEHALTRRDVIAVDLQAICSVFEIVADAHTFRRQLLRFAHGHESGAERVGERGGEDKSAGFDAQEDSNHFLDLDWEGYGKYPYSGLPRDYTAAVAKFGKKRIEDNGTLPWRTEEMFGNLQRAFESYGRRGPFGRFDILFFSAWLTHYVSDAHVPFHAVLNYDGQLTGQHGLHSRFEAFLFERYRDQWTIAPKPIEPIRNPRDFIFEVVLQGTQLVPPILKADLDAIGGRDEYDDAYYAAFFKANRAVVERRLNESIAASAAMIAGAWEAAGKPAVPVNPRPTVQRRRR